MNIISMLGLIAGTLTTVAQIPQAYRIWKLRETRDISLPTYIITLIGVSLWLVYGVIINNPPLYIANGITFIIIIFITGLKLKYG